MPEGTDLISLTVNGATVMVPERTTVAAAVLIVETATRVSVVGEPRGPLCGMGICFECRVIIDGLQHQRSCQVLCEPGMKVVTSVNETNASCRGPQTP
jgi:D-hydroxyproline dehydrogenase subunit gamma